MKDKILEINGHILDIESEDDFFDKFFTFLEDNNWTFAGVTSEKEDKKMIMNCMECGRETEVTKVVCSDCVEKKNK
ncbi:MAG: hypothetical protein ACFFG0_18850 [Candidatus Thorarchaeota archaeon]